MVDPAWLYSDTTDDPDFIFNSNGVYAKEGFLESSAIKPVRSETVVRFSDVFEKTTACVSEEDLRDSSALKMELAEYEDFIKSAVR